MFLSIGLRVETTHCDTLKRKFVIGGITQKSANQETFECDGKQVTIQQYMREKYNVTLRYYIMIELNCNCSLEMRS